MWIIKSCQKIFLFFLIPKFVFFVWILYGFLYGPTCWILLNSPPQRKMQRGSCWTPPLEKTLNLKIWWRYCPHSVRNKRKQKLQGDLFVVDSDWVDQQWVGGGQDHSQRPGGGLLRWTSPTEVVWWEFFFSFSLYNL